MKKRDLHACFTPGWIPPKPSFDFAMQGYFPLRGKKQFLIDGVVALDEISVTYGDPSAGKGNFALSMALAAASASPWFGRSSGVIQEDGSWWPAGTVYFALERASQVERRIDAYVTDRGITYDLPIAVCDAVFDIREEGAGSAIVETMYDAHSRMNMCSSPDGGICDYKPDFNLCIIDTLAMAMAGGSDTDPGDLGRAILACHQIRQATGAHVMVIHHSPTNGDNRMRGHGSLNAAIDMSFHVAQRKKIRVGEVMKNSDGPEQPKFYFSLRSVDGRAFDEEAGEYVTNSPAPVLVEEEEPKAGNLERVKQPVKVKGPKVSKSEAPVLAALAGIQSPATEEAWRAAYDEAREDGISPGNHRTRFSRGKDSLSVKGLIRQEGDIWSVTVSALQSENCNSDETVT